MKKINNLVEKFVFAGDKQNPDTHRKGRFFIISMFIFAIINLSYIPYYLAGSVQTVPYVKPLFYTALGALLLIFIIYPRYGYCNLLFILFVFPSAIASFASVYYSTGGLYSSDIGLSAVMILFIFLVSNKTIGILSTLIHIIIYIYFYYAAINNYRNFQQEAMALGPDYYIANSLVCFVFCTIMIVLHENSKDKYLAELKKAKTEIEYQKAEIISSINYAQRIQQSKLPNPGEFKNHLPQSFILFKPKDIVSGDFYYFKKENETIYVAAADCTGHGVPGAIMSMICSEKLEEAINTTNNMADILSTVNKGIKQSLKQTEGDNTSKDGMDIALCAINKNTNQLTYTGANRPLWVIRHAQNTLEEIKATKSAIGGHTPNNQQFVSHQVNMQPGDTFYIFTDGYADQFGGATGKKIMTRNLKNILLNIQSKTMQEQQTHLDEFLETWKAGLEQIDDVLVIGVKM